MNKALPLILLIPLLEGCSVWSLLAPPKTEVVVTRELTSCPMVMPILECAKAGKFIIPNTADPEWGRIAELDRLRLHRQSSCKDKWIRTVLKHSKECQKRERKK